MSKLYIITGPAGVGKSTISRRLAKQRTQSALIEGDEIYGQVVGGYIQAWKEGNHLEIFWKICINNIRVYLENGFDVIFNYIVTPNALELLKNEFKDYEVKFIVLLADETTLLMRDKERPKDCQMGERCIILLDSFKNKNYSGNNILDTSKLLNTNGVLLFISKLYLSSLSNNNMPLQEIV